MKELFNFSSRKEWEDYLWKEFVKILNNKRNSEKDIYYFLDSLLTVKEKRNIIRRLVIISLIKKGKSYKEISEILWLSPNTISSINKSFKNNRQYQSYFEIFKNKNNNNQTQTVKTSKQFGEISWGEMADASVELLEAFNKVLNKLLPPMTFRRPMAGKGRQRE